ncbi:MAG: hypothetical protein ACJAYU_000577 [Bradymonadia bacterium]|jgi:hypothetical protein
MRTSCNSSENAHHTLGVADRHLGVNAAKETLRRYLNDEFVGIRALGHLTFLGPRGSCSGGHSHQKRAKAAPSGATLIRFARSV